MEGWLQTTAGLTPELIQKINLLSFLRGAARARPPRLTPAQALLARLPRALVVNATARLKEIRRLRTRARFFDRADRATAIVRGRGGRDWVKGHWREMGGHRVWVSGFYRDA